MRRILRLRPNKERGQALVEFSLVAIVFFIVVFGMFEVGRAVWHYNTLAQATREGARYAVVHGARCEADPSCTVADAPSIEQVVENNASTLEPDDVAVGVEWICRIGAGSCNDVWDHVEVTSEYDFQPATFLSGLFDLPPITITSSSTMEVHY